MMQSVYVRLDKITLGVYDILAGDLRCARQ